MIDIIKINEQINMNSIEEFIRIVIPKTKTIDIEIQIIRIRNEIKIEVSDTKKSEVFIFSDYGKLVENQILIIVKGALYNFFNVKKPWGTLIGVRPTKLVNTYLKRMEKTKLIEILKNLYYVSDEKINLLLKIYEIQKQHLQKKMTNLYVGIPFCPHKCNYCSFASYKLEKKYKLYFSDFLKTVSKELEEIGNILKENKIYINNIYIGGGTPAILSEQEIEKLLLDIENLIPLKLAEYTFEAGRIELTTIEKLNILKKYGVNRISLNPQTFNKKILIKLKRDFEFSKFKKLYDYATNYFIVNMDFILGLEFENTKSICDTFEKLREFDLQNITIHSLALKRSSKLYKEGYKLRKFDYFKIKETIEKIMKEQSMVPYYLYRQKNSYDELENIGYSKKGMESHFNIQMIDEMEQTIAIGGGAITKIINKGRVNRQVNPKDPIVYINEYDKRIEEKKKLIQKYF